MRGDGDRREQDREQPRGAEHPHGPHGRAAVPYRRRRQIGDEPLQLADRLRVKALIDPGGELLRIEPAFAVIAAQAVGGRLAISVARAQIDICVHADIVPRPRVSVIGPREVLALHPRQYGILPW